MMIYKVFRPREWAEFHANGTTLGAPVDREDGFIHFSTSAQLAETLAKHFAEEPELVLARVDTDTMHLNLKWEPSRGGQLFPHLYRALDIGEVAQVADIRLTNGVHVLPDWVA